MDTCNKLVNNFIINFHNWQMLCYELYIFKLSSLPAQKWRLSGDGSAKIVSATATKKIAK